MHNSHVHETSFSLPLSSATCDFRAAIFPQSFSPAARRADLCARGAFFTGSYLKNTNTVTSTSMYIVRDAQRPGSHVAIYGNRT